MDHDLFVLRALARLSRQRKAVDCDTLVFSVSRAAHAGSARGGARRGEDDARASLDRLERAALVERSGKGQVRLTMAGLAWAVASAAARRRASPREAGASGASARRGSGVRSGDAARPRAA